MQHYVLSVIAWLIATADFFALIGVFGLGLSIAVLLLNILSILLIWLRLGKTSRHSMGV